jgi:hypothetical protein
MGLGKQLRVQVKRVISKRIRRTGPGIDLVADVNADVSVNVAEGRRVRPKRSTRKDGTTEERRSR